MRTHIFFVAAALFVAPDAAAAAQSISRVASGIPAWADSALAQAGFASRYQLTSTLNPDVGWGDFDGDGLFDLALGIVEPGGRRRGIAVIHRVDWSVHIVGAGQPIGNGADDIPWSATWDVERLHWHRDGLYVTFPRRGSGWLIWNGRSYAWVQDSE